MLKPLTLALRGKRVKDGALNARFAHRLLPEGERELPHPRGIYLS